MTLNVGLYIQANDHVREWTIAFLQSLRAHSPDLRTVLIPWDDRIDFVGGILARRFDVEILDVWQQWREQVEFLDGLGRKHYPDRPSKWPHFRRFLCFWGPLQYFLYSDVDIVILSDLQVLLQTYVASNVDLMYIATSEGDVYQDGPFREKMVSEFGSREFNSGFWASKKNAVSTAELVEACEEGFAIPSGFSPGVFDQHILNYCFDRKRAKRLAFQDVLQDLPTSIWSNPERKGLLHVGEDGAYWDESLPAGIGGRRLPILHWAGFEAHPAMPFRSLFVKWRLYAEPLHNKLAFFLADYYRHGPSMVRQMFARHFRTATNPCGRAG